MRSYLEECYQALRSIRSHSSTARIMDSASSRATDALLVRLPRVRSTLAGIRRGTEVVPRDQDFPLASTAARVVQLALRTTEPRAARRVAQRGAVRARAARVGLGVGTPRGRRHARRRFDRPPGAVAVEGPGAGLATAAIRARVGARDPGGVAGSRVRRRTDRTSRAGVRVRAFRPRISRVTSIVPEAVGRSVDPRVLGGRRVAAHFATARGDRTEHPQPGKRHPREHRARGSCTQVITAAAHSTPCNHQAYGAG